MNTVQLEKKQKQRRGVITLELILTMPLLIMFVLAIVEFGVLLAQVKQVEFASREGARLAAVQSQASLSSAIGTVANRVERVLQTGDIPSYCRVTLQHNVAGVSNPTQTVGTCVCPAPTTPPLPSGTNLASVRVTVCVDMDALAPDLLDTLGFSLNGKIVSQTSTWPYVESSTPFFTGNIYLACSLPPGPASVTLVDPNTANRSITSSAGTGTGNPPPLSPTDIVWDNTNQRIIYSDPSRLSIVAVDPSNGNRTILSSTFPATPVGSGPPLVGVTGLALEPSGNLLTISPLGLFRINPATGDRTVLSSSTTGTGPIWSLGDTVAVNAAGSIYVVGRAPLASVYAVDSVSGNRQLISADTISTPPQLRIGNPSDAIFDASGDLLIAGNLNIISLDVSSFVRTQVSGVGMGTGSPIVSPQGIAVQTNGTILVTDNALQAVMAVDPSNGNRTVFSSSSVGTGPNCGPGIRDLTIVP